MKVVAKEKKVIEVDVEINMEEGKFYDCWGIIICPIGNQFITFSGGSVWVKDSIDASDVNHIKDADMEAVKKNISGLESVLTQLKALIPND